MARWWCVAAALAAAWCALGGAAPAQDLAARRRSATDRTFIRFGRSDPEMSLDEEEPAGESKHSRFTRARQDNVIRLGRSDSYLRFGRSPLRLSRDDLVELLARYEDDGGAEKRRANNFVRLGRRDNNFVRLGRRDNNFLRLGRRENNFLRLGRRDSNFLRLGRSAELFPDFEVNGEILVTHHQPERKKDSHLRLGRGDMDGNGLVEEEQDEESRKKRSLEVCPECAE